MKKLWIVHFCLFWAFAVLNAQVATTIEDFFLPGSQPLESGDLSTPASCACHQFNSDVDAYFGWEGSMMGQAMRDQLFIATMSIASQDADSSADLCLRCHTPTGWLSGRSEPPDGSALIDEDFTGVNCLFCHRMIMPAETGENPFPFDPDYTNPYYSSTDFSTYHADSVYRADFISAHIPPTTANGMFVVTNDDERRGPYTDPANPNHGFYYSPFHKISANCGTCHDVSNPVYSRNEDGSYSLNTLGEPAPDFSPYALFPVERTYSEWKMSAYNTAQGISGTPFGGNKSFVSACQDCHMADVTGRGASRGNAPIRNDLGLHDFTGGNTFMPLVVKAQHPTTTNATALDSAVSRATWMLQHAATMELSVTGPELEVHIQNETGHKLPSGYPEGRRMWLNVRVFDDMEQLIYESGNYDPVTAVLTHDADIKVYEIKPGISNALAGLLDKTAGPSFHFVLNDTIYSDNRIPPRGFTNANFEDIQSPAVAYSYADGQFWDITNYPLPENRKSVIVTLYYQTTSKEYVEFLRDENITDTNGQEMYDLWEQNGKSTPIAMVPETWVDEPNKIFTQDLENGSNLLSSLRISGPNPFNSQIKFEYIIAKNGSVEISVFNISGKKVAVLVDQFHSKGKYSINWIADDISSGTYFVRLNTRDEIDIQKVILIK